MPHSASMRAGPPGPPVAERPPRPSSPENRGATSFGDLLDAEGSGDMPASTPNIGHGRPSHERERPRDVGPTSGIEARGPERLPPERPAEDPPLPADPPDRAEGLAAMTGMREGGDGSSSAAPVMPERPEVDPEEGETGEPPAVVSAEGDVKPIAAEPGSGDRQPDTDVSPPDGSAPPVVMPPAAVPAMGSADGSGPMGLPAPAAPAPGPVAVLAAPASSAREAALEISDRAVRSGPEAAVSKPGKGPPPPAENGGRGKGASETEAAGSAPPPATGGGANEAADLKAPAKPLKAGKGPTVPSTAAAMPAPKDADFAPRAESSTAATPGAAPSAAATLTGPMSAALAPLGPGGTDGAFASGPTAAPADTGRLIPIAGLAIEIASRLAEGKRRFEVRLDPPELGRIDVRLDIGRDGQVTSRLVVERAETLDLLRRDAPTLQQALQSAGLRADGGGLHFSLRDHGNSHPLPFVPAPKLLIVPDADVAVHEAVRRGYGVLRGLGRGIDIRV